MSEAYFHQYGARLDAVEALGQAADGVLVGGPASVAASALRALATATEDERTKTTYSDFGDALTAVDHLVRWTAAVRGAEVDADRFLRAAKQLARDIQRRSQQRTTCVAGVLPSILEVSSPEDVESVAGKMLNIALPFAESGTSPRVRPPKSSADRSADSEHTKPVAFLSFRLNDAEFKEGHVVQPNVLHDLEVQVRMSRWPTSAQRFHLVPVHVEPAGVISAPSFTLELPEQTDAPLTTTLRGRLSLAVSQDFLARPIELVYVGYVEPRVSGAELVAGEVLVQGQRRLLFESYDPRVNPVTGFSDVDVKLREIRTQARGHGISDAEIRDLLTVVAAAGRIASQAIADDLYPGEWSEAQFQADVRSRLRMDRLIASELEEHAHATGGITDLSYRHIRVELKADDEGEVTIDTACDRYGQQTAQYVAGSDRRSGVLVVLDTERKTAAPGSVQNDIGIRAIASPNGHLEILLAVVVVRGHLATPSDLS